MGREAGGDCLRVGGGSGDVDGLLEGCVEGGGGEGDEPEGVVF